MDWSDDGETAVVFQPENSQFVQVDLFVQLQQWSLIFSKYLQHGKKVGRVSSHWSRAQVAEGSTTIIITMTNVKIYNKYNKSKHLKGQL